MNIIPDTSTALSTAMLLTIAVMKFDLVTTKRARLICAVVIGIFCTVVFALLSGTVWTQQAVAAAILQSLSIAAASAGLILSPHELAPPPPVSVPNPPEVQP